MFRVLTTVAASPCRAAAGRALAPGTSSAAVAALAAGAPAALRRSCLGKQLASESRGPAVAASLPLSSIAPTPLAAWMQARFGGSWKRTGPVQNSNQVFAPYPLVPYGVKRSDAYRTAKKAARKAAERARRAVEEKGMILDPKKQLRMELKRNTGIGWTRSLTIIKHLEMHERGKGPPIDQAVREKITRIARVVRMGH
mmetsp:Transcript_36425/g.77471  ORF Transcript_36425/g.77471 Transcript_36425/m.77471 type:complete len:198 (+) Transcript_36425:159-752(+)|eukprot:CAMPEP_0194780262 /NCGR_PEP_ID=MMETSP0323_2-20130528/73230_1 /TAXON_ID=2866 ORGANISM="Crypthecodinium cohnii, Strain Seligo" /NCGR_SAMPLE_ID=MMETSP0323_2 /ASSEMBLY_ACC=CAM_ASM_000346 /LENGTH=197 /DNA_ID=CAMNT_0039718187 /DNA_START=55 /DNA_END=648 /DNA_ORIENTATION=-